MSEEMSYRNKPWLKSYERGVPENIIYEELSLPDILERTASQFPDQSALLYQGCSINFRQFKELVDRFASFLSVQGVRRGQAVAILLPNCIPCVVAYYAVLRIGGIVVMNNPLYTDPELLHQFNDSEACFLVTLDLLGNRMIDLREKTKIKQIVYASLGDYLPFLKKLIFHLLGVRKKWSAPVKKAPEVFSWRKCIRGTSSPFQLPKDGGFHDLAVYQYTGGTTGLPKGVELTHANLSKQVQQCAAWFPAFKKGREIMLGALPYFHAFGMTTTMNLSVYMGWAQLLVPRPQSGPLLAAIRKHRPTFAPLVPTMYAGMLKHPHFSKTDMSCLKGAFSGGAPLSEELKQNFEQKTGAIIVEGYGMTETSPVTLINPFAQGAQKRGSVGLPIPDTLCRIVDLENGTSDVPLGQRGELIIQGPQVMKGYKDKPVETAEIIRNGWCYTGDIAVMDHDGYVFLVDRKKDLIISGGYNIYPHEIEAVLNSNLKVEESCAVGIPDERKGEKVKVFLVLKEGERATEQEMLNFCRERLAAYKLPVEIEFRTELPKSHLGKTLRRKL
jgi:long-chain acyl-CoA synthetase